jgi:hypothetical protein
MVRVDSGVVWGVVVWWFGGLVVVVGVLVSLVVVGGDVYVEDGSSAGRERCSILIVEAESDG